MRAHVKNVIEAKDASALLESSTLHANTKFSEDTPPIIQKVLDEVSKVVDFKLYEESYWRVQPTPINGIWWHIDTGNTGHMAWCSYGVSILLSDEFGGRMKYRVNGIEEVVSGRERFDMYIHSSEEEHMIEAPEQGKTRTVLLLFI